MRKKFIVITTIPASLRFFEGQLSFLNQTFEVIAVSSDKKVLEEVGRREGISVHCIPMERPISLCKDIISFYRFIVFFLKSKPYIVHGNTPKGGFLSMLSAKIANVPIRIYMCHGLRYQGYGGLMRKLLQMMERISCMCATEVICVSVGVKQTLLSDHICKEQKLKVIAYGSANGINLNRVDKQKIDTIILPQISKGSFIFCFVGRIVKDKGVNELITAFDRLSAENEDVHLVMVGSIENEQNPIAEITKNTMQVNSHVHAVGFQSDVRPYMNQSDTFVLPSYREGFGLVLMEAGALGVPCITTDIIGCNEIIQDGINGRIIPPRDEDALYHAMKWFYEHRNDEVKEMARRARPMIVERYEQHKVWEALLEEYRSLENEGA